MDDPKLAKAAGVVELPSWVRWSGVPRRYDLRNRADRALVYEQVLTEGTDDDVRYFVVIGDLIDLWPELVLPSYVRAAWTDWLESRRRITPPSEQGECLVGGEFLECEHRTERAGLCVPDPGIDSEVELRQAAG